MAAVLTATVIVDGETYEAGTEATAELRKKISNPAAWSEPEKSSKTEK